MSKKRRVHEKGQKRNHSPFAGMQRCYSEIQSISLASQAQASTWRVGTHVSFA